MVNTKKMFQKILLSIVLMFGIHSVVYAEYRCGWLDNPEPGHFQLTDKEAVWTISKREAYRIPDASLKKLPARDENQFIRTNGSFGYSCSCLSVTTDTVSRRIKSINFKGKQVLLKRCLEDKTIAHRQPTMIRKLPGSSINHPSGSYTDTPVVSESSGLRFPNPPVTRVSRSKQSGSHFIQVIVTSIPAKAKRMKKSFVRAGFKTTISDIKSGGKVLHKVKVGPYPNRRSALKAQTKLKKSFKQNFGVNKSIIVS